MLEIKLPIDLNAISQFIARLNKHNDQHVGYCGTEKDEILHTLLNEFSDLPFENSVVAAYENEQLVGFIGFDIDQEMRVGEVWGPFVEHDEWDKISLLLWNELLEKTSGAVLQLNGFYNIHNERCHSFMGKVGAESDDRESFILKITRDEFHVNEIDDTKINEYTHEYAESFKQLHHQAFNQPYFNADEMIKKCNQKNKLFVATDSTNQLLGYVYCEANPKFSEGDIHFIAVAPEVRNKGVGTKLINKSLQFLFSFSELNEIILCVTTNNEAAIKIYKNAGFTEIHRLVSYKKILGERN